MNLRPLGNKVVNSLLSIINNPLQVEVFFWNFFSSYDLLKKYSHDKNKRKKIMYNVMWQSRLIHKYNSEMRGVDLNANIGYNFIVSRDN